MTATRTPATPGSRRWIFWIFLALAVFYLGVEHRAHLAGALRWLPLAILLLCPLMHVFMHKGHGGHSHGGTDDSGHVGPRDRRDTNRSDDPSDASTGGH
ncbi:MAG: hypothetical protein ABS82_07910 [Rhodanobacter sp. SCN 67-45]|nr:MAG: hypothetical protein ABS82_07910 [Rhodanobacter sp. SCN 67-45]